MIHRRVPNLAHKRLKELLFYDPETGLFTRLVRTSNNIKIGDVAGTKLNTGYISISIDGQYCLAHRLAWFYINGAWPKDQIDHINLDRADNRIANLREASNGQNMANGSKRADNKSGAKGVCWCPKRKKWRASLQLNSKHVYLGRYSTLEEAAAAYRKAATEYRGEYART
jgi:hypothetical protein